MSQHVWALNSSPASAVDIIVVGAGLAGTTAALLLGKQGYRVTLVDPRSSFPALFKAEKIEPEQAQLLRKFGLLEHLLPHAGRIHELRAAYNGRVFRIRPIEQYGIRYGDMVNSLRAQLPPSVERKLGRVTRTTNSPDFQRVRLESGEELTARLVILACGAGGQIWARLGLRRQLIQKDQSIVFGFDVARADGKPFSFDAVTYYPTSYKDHISYLTLFRVCQTTRANLFAFRSLTEPWARQFVKEPGPMLERCLPKLSRVIGEYCVASKVETGHIDLYRVDGQPLPGVVLIGDAAQNVCPSTGKGLSKVFTDVDVLCSECVPVWLATPRMGCDKIQDFYNHPRKRAIDSRARDAAVYLRQASTDRSLRWRIHRLLRLYIPMQFGKPSRRPDSPVRSVRES